MAAAQAKFGGRAKADAEDTQTLLLTIRSQIMELFDSVDLGPLQAVLKDVRDLLDSSLGKELKTSFTEMMSTLFEAIFGPLKDKGAMESIVQGVIGAIKGITAFIKDAAPGVKAFVASFKEGFAKVWPVIQAVGSVLAKVFSGIGGGESTATKVGQALGIIAGALVVVAGLVAAVTGVFISLGVSAIDAVLTIYGVIMTIVTAFDSAIACVRNFFSSIWEGVSGAGAGGDGIGSAIVNGIIAGIMGGEYGVIGAIVGVAKGAINAAMGALDAHSPSRVFQAIGGFVSTGMAQGIDGGASKAAGSATKMAQKVIAAGSGVSVPQAGGAANDGGAGGAAGGGGISITVQVQAKDGASAKEQGEQAGEAAERVLRRYVRRVATRG